jgi:imidazolonepropionase-like amidohydrolase
MIRRSLVIAGFMVLGAGAAVAPERSVDAQPQTVTVFRGARLIVGDGSPALDDAAFVVRGDRFVAVGPSAAIDAPAGATSVDLRGQTVMPAIVDAHSHIGYM